MHPPEVTDLLDQIDALQNKQTGALRLESTPSGCAARLNGVLLGETPVSIGKLFPGQYRVQVECDPAKRGRVHFVTVGAGRTERRVDSRFDDTVESRPSLQLRYANAAEAREHEASDARRIATEVSASSVVLLSMRAADSMHLERVDATSDESPRPSAVARVSIGRSGPSKADLDAAARTLIAGECTDFTSSKPVALPCGRDEPNRTATPSDWPAGRRPRGQFISGLTLVGLGIAGLATGYALCICRATTRAWIGSPVSTRISRIDGFNRSGSTSARESSSALRLVRQLWSQRCRSRYQSARRPHGGAGWPVQAGSAWPPFRSRTASPQTQNRTAVVPVSSSAQPTCEPASTEVSKSASRSSPA